VAQYIHKCAGCGADCISGSRVYECTSCGGDMRLEYIRDLDPVSPPEPSREAIDDVMEGFERMLSGG
jgi:hypothetical protein